MRKSELDSIICMLAKEKFHLVLMSYTLFERHRILEEIEEIMKNNNLYNIDSESTYFRRASTVISWVDWIINLIK